MVTVRDTSDTGYFLDEHGDLTLARILLFALWFRHFGNVKVWKALQARSCFDEVALGLPPDWNAIAEVLEKLWTERLTGKGAAVYSPLYRSRLLTHYAHPLIQPSRGGRDWGTGPLAHHWHPFEASAEELTVKDRVERDVISMACLYEAAMHTSLACAAYERNPSKEAYTVLYDSIERETTTRTKGIFGEYGLKLTLDILICSGRVDSAHVTKWPMNCDGYPETMKAVFPGLHKKHWMAAMLYVYREIGGKYGYSFPEVAMHWCWHKRRKSNMMDDKFDRDAW